MQSHLIQRVKGDRQQTGAITVVDARSAGRFRGEDPEPRAGLKSGHIPHSISLPFTELLETDPVTGVTHLKKPPMLLQVFLQCGLIDSNVGLQLDRPIITTCGSGVTASVLALGLHELGFLNVAVYDGSWTEWVCHATVFVLAPICCSCNFTFGYCVFLQAQTPDVPIHTSKMKES